MDRREVNPVAGSVGADSPRRLRGRRLLVACVGAVLTLALALAVTACGGGSSSSSTGGGTTEGGSSGNSEAETAKAELAKLYKGELGKPASTGPAPEAGKNVWAIVPSFEIAGSKLAVDEFKAGAEEVGWDVTVREGKFSPSEELSEVREAVRLGADAIWLEAIECEAVKAGLLEAQKAGVVVVASNAFDCKQPLFTAETEYEPGDITAYAKRAGEAQAIWAIAETDAEAKVLLVYENDIQATRILNEAAKQRLEKCATCEIVGEVAITGAEYGPPLQQKVEQALLKYPETTIVNGNLDAIVENGVAAAVRSSGKQLPVLGFEGEPNNVEMIRNGEQAMTGTYPFGWAAYSAVDAINRLLAGEKEVGNSGAGIQVIDAKHNLPAKGETYQPPVDYKKYYREAWGLG